MPTERFRRSSLMIKIKNAAALLLFSLSVSLLSPLAAQVRLPRLIGNGMVMQRDAEVKIWGWASPGEAISIQFRDAVYRTTTDNEGAWKVMLPALKAGGPHDMVIRASNEIRISDVLIGDVWICSGQSNMELPMRRVSPLYADEMTHSNPFIRQFTVPQRYDFNNPQQDLPAGEWKSANPENIPAFSAVAYFFAKELYDANKVPIGLINASLGGSPAEAWLCEDKLKDFPAYHQELQRFKDSTLIRQIESGDNARIGEWYRTLRQKDEGYKNTGQTWLDPALSSDGWGLMSVPGYWANTGLGPVNGVVWFRKNIQIPASMAGQAALLNLGRIVDADSVFLNGVFVGTTSYQYPPRRYNVPAGLLREGDNTLVVRVINSAGKGGFVPEKPYELVAAGQTIDLKGDWQYRLGAVMEPLASQTFVRWKPAGLFNAMIHPLLDYRIKGAIWYQGESNTRNPLEYRSLFPAMINDWREHWKQGDFPFLFVQLANFMEARDQPSESAWAMLREAQQRALSLPETGMAVTIDIGEWNDIHPLNKKDVGKRLAWAAQKIAYENKKIAHSGPVFQSMEIEGANAVLTFTNAGKKLRTKDGGLLKGFAIAGPDQRFVWAEARIKKNKVIVHSPDIPNPAAVRYAWADNPADANLYNKAGLPAAPFRTDAWMPATLVQAGKGLKDYYKNYFPIGVAVNPRMLEPGANADFITAQFNSLTAENAMKMGPIHPEENRYNWEPADKIVDFAVKNGLRMRGHTLCWHSQTPGWFFIDSTGKDVGKEVLLARLKRHIYDVAGRYKGKVYAWDVVNEAVPDGGSDLYRKSKFFDIIGEEYIEKAFQYAHEADPEALLFYNDYNTESASKRERIYQLIRKLKEKGVPIHGVGLQGHWSLYEPTAAELETSIARFAELGLQVQITELDVSVYAKEHERRERRPTDTDIFTPEMEARQAAHYQMLFEVFRKHKDKISSVTFWNLSDKASWLDNFPVQGRKDYPLLFDQNNQPKKAFHAVTRF